MSTDQFQCRMYEAKYPELEELVMVNVRQITELGAYVRLLEYDNIEGMILLSEFSRRRIRSVQKLIRVGRNEVALVLRVDKEKGYIDLSKRRVAPEDLVKCEEKYNKSKAVHSIMRHVAEKIGCPVVELYDQFGWPLYRKYGHAYGAFKLALQDPDTVFEGLELQPQVQAELIANIKRRMAPQPVKLRADVEVTCYSYEGIDAIKAALTACEHMSTDDVPIKVRLVAPPLYVLTAVTTEKQEGIDTLERAIAAIAESLAGQQGNVAVKMKPRVVSATDEKELAELMERFERENAEVSGDEDDEEADDE
ncbi:translation initiation factor eIF2 alpha subunit [Blastocladiella britannica]|nr:translation initiation factor eIF2 alpha subunit [Blastocladiella britannica]